MIHILSTCRRPEGLKMATLVFDTLRVGFPHENVKVHINGDVCREDIDVAARSAGCETFHAHTIHHEWIAGLIAAEREPFIVLDTDVIFYDPFDMSEFRGPLHGYRTPEFQDSFTQSVTRARLHTSLLYIDPEDVRRRVGLFTAPSLGHEFAPVSNPVYPVVVAMNGFRVFYDTCSVLYHAIGGNDFTDQQKDKYFHFHFGTIDDIVFPKLPAEEAEAMKSTRKRVLDNPYLGRGMWREQERYYRNHPAIWKL